MRLDKRWFQSVFGTTQTTISNRVSHLYSRRHRGTGRRNDRKRNEPLQKTMKCAERATIRGPIIHKTILCMSPNPRHHAETSGLSHTKVGCDRISGRYRSRCRSGQSKTAKVAVSTGGTEGKSPESFQARHARCYGKCDT